MFSQTAEYALRAIIWLASNPEFPFTSQQIARSTQVPPDYLSKVMQSLGRAQIVRARRGKNGGFILALPAADLTILDVVNAVDPIRRIRTCPLSLKAHRQNLCRLHRRLDQALEMIETAFRETSIADLLADSSSERPLCEIVETVHA